MELIDGVLESVTAEFLYSCPLNFPVRLLWIDIILCIYIYALHISDCIHYSFLAILLRITQRLRF